MCSLKLIGICLALISPILCQQYAQGGGDGQYNNQQDQYNNYNRPPPPQILTHKQALNHDGNFKYLFTSENGLAQGESIAPDGSRNGGYSYVDPNGKKISVKYTAGKEGFRILEADHLPKAPQPLVPVPGLGQQAGYPATPQALGGRPHDDGQYRPHLYQSAPQPPPQLYTQPRAYPTQLAPQQHQVPLSNSINDAREPDYNDAPGKPYSFGNGYVFEFGG